jgi:hypothetical protein
MSLKKYFESTNGFSVLSTSDRDGKVNAAVYSRPHVMEDGAFAFIMNDRLTHHNLKSNPQAAYLFREDGGGYKGKRFSLTMVREEQDTELLKKLRERTYPNESYEGPKFLVFFKIDEELSLIQ